MDRQEKEALVAQLGEEIREAESIFAIDYRGISVGQSAELRSKLREADASFRVVKNRLTKLAAEKAGVAELEAMLEGPTALTFVRGDTAAAAKAITTFNREYEVLTYKGGLMGDTLLDEDRFQAIAKLPTRDALNAQLAGIVASPIVGLTRGLGSMVQGLAIQLSQIAEQGLVGGSAEPEAEVESGEASDDGAEETPAEAPEAPGEESAEEDGGDSGDAGNESPDEPTAEAEEETSDESTDEVSEEQPGEEAAADDGDGEEAADGGDAGDSDGEGAAEEGDPADGDDGDGEEPAGGDADES